MQEVNFICEIKQEEKGSYEGIASGEEIMRRDFIGGGREERRND